MLSKGFSPLLVSMMTMFIGSMVSAEVVDSFTCRLAYLNARGKMQEGGPSAN